MAETGAAPEIEDHRCRLLVRVPAVLEDELRRVLVALAAADRLAGIVADADAVPTDLPEGLTTALLLAGAFEPEGGADGVLVRLGEDAEMEATALRRAWGADGLVVGDVGTSRHRAMEAGEFGVDAVLFAGTEEAVGDCLDWWQGLFVLPAGARASDATLERFVATGADLLLVDDSWLTEDVIRRIAVAEEQRPAAGLGSE